MLQFGIFRMIMSAMPLSSADWVPIIGDHGLLSTELRVRKALYRIIAALFQVGGGSTAVNNALLEGRLFVCKHDEEDDEAKELAEAMWASFATNLPAAVVSDNFASGIVYLLTHKHPNVREAAAKALAGGISVHTHLADSIIDQVLSIYVSSGPVLHEKIRLGAALPAGNIAVVGKLSEKSAAGASGKKDKKEKDSSSSVTSPVAPLSSAAGAVTIEDIHFDARVAVGFFIAAIGKSRCLYGSSARIVETSIRLEDNESAAVVVKESADIDALIGKLLDFLLSQGVVDMNEAVRSKMIAAGRALIDGYGSVKGRCAMMLEAIQAVLARKNTSMKHMGEAEIAAFDNRHEAAVVLLGAVGKHLNKDDAAIYTIADTLVSALNIPSESVQIAVSDCLAPLVAVIKGTEQSTNILQTLMTNVVEGKSYGDRRGAAMGLAACVKGLGIPSLKQFDVVNRLKDVCSSNSSSANGKQGALFAVECLSEKLGLLFEPYVIAIVPVLLKSFSHSSDHVREAAQGAAKVIMGKLSAHGVKQMLTPILTSLATETQWKSRQEAIRLLGTMANCAPKQLSACLPQVPAVYFSYYSGC
jgi:hypothetical protein